MEEKFELKVVIGKHPISQKYYTVHKKLGIMDNEEFIRPALAGKKTRLVYNQ